MVEKGGRWKQNKEVIGKIGGKRWWTKSGWKKMVTEMHRGRIYGKVMYWKGE